MASLGKVLTCEIGESNPHNPFAVIINQSVGCTIFNFHELNGHKNHKKL